MMRMIPCILALLLVMMHRVDAAPTVTSVSPPPQSLTIQPTAHILVSFDTSMNAQTIDSTTVLVFGHWSGVARGQFLLEENNTQLRFIPEQPFFAGEWVTVNLSRRIASQSGDSMAFGYAWNFWIRTLPGTLNLQETHRFSLRRPGEGRIQAYGAYAGDLDRDGWTDFIVPNEISRDIRVLMNDGTGGFGPFTVYPLPSGQSPSTNEGSDYNSDGIIDIAVGNAGGDSVAVFIGDGTGSFSSVRNYQSANGVRGLTVMDLNGDGHMDIVTANRIGDKIALLRNNGDGTFAQRVLLEANGSQETACVSADANGDGILDLFVGAFFSREIILMLGNGNGDLVFSHKVTVTGQPWMIAVGDVNGDGNVDVISANSTGNNVTIVRGNGNGQLLPPVSYPTGSFPLAIDVGDIDGDGDLEIVTSNYGSGTWTLYENAGNGTFINPRTFQAQEAGSCATLHDRDNDGDMDMTGIDEVDDIIFLFTNGPQVHVGEKENVPDRFELLQNYPNPFNPGTTVRFTLPFSSFTSIKVYDILGRDVATLVDEHREAGRHSVIWDASAVSSGVYFYEMRAGSFRSVRSLAVVR